MAPFLVILLLLALGAGIIAWHTIGYPHAPAPTRASKRTASGTPARPEPQAPVAAATEPVFAPSTSFPPPPVSRTSDPFAHAPPLDQEPRP